MALTTLQINLLQYLRNAVRLQQTRQFVYRTEYLGYLPFGLYHWVEVDSQDISRDFPSEWSFDWSRRDLDALAAAGLLSVLDEWRSPTDDLESKVTYEVIAA